jgi:hypothetical protein
LNTETFIAQQKEMSDGFIDRITLQLQDFVGPEVEAIVVGFDKETDHAHLYEINTKGTVHCFDDIGFCAIGSGSWHARSRLMQARYISGWNLSLALTALYAAKKSTEAAPGIGKTTDVHMILRDGAQAFWPHVVQHLDKLLDEYNERNNELVKTAVLNLQAYLDDPKNYPQAIPQSSSADKKAGIDRGADSATAGRSIETGAQHAPESSDQLQGKEPQP